MHMQAKPVDQTKMLTLVALLSDYDMFRINVDDGTEFNSTEIIGTRFGCLEFKRCFATSVYSDDIIIDIVAINRKSFICKTPNKTYHIFALHNKPPKPIIRKSRYWRDVFDFMNINYFGERSTTYNKECDEVFFAVDPHLLGELSAEESGKIRNNIINSHLGGLHQKTQTSRSIYFSFCLSDKLRRIYAGVCDLENLHPLTKKLIYDESNATIISSKVSEKVNSIYSYAKQHFLEAQQ